MREDGDRDKDVVLNKEGLEAGVVREADDVVKPSEGVTPAISECRLTRWMRLGP